MNAFRVAVLLLISVVAASFADETNTPDLASVTSNAAPSGVTSNPLPTTITIDGTTYENVRWERITPTTVTVFHKTGVATILLAKLPPELQQRFGYDPQKAEAVTKQQAETKQSVDLEKVRGTIEYLDARYGFRNLNFEQSIDSCPGLKLVSVLGDEKCYVRGDEDLQLGNVKLKEIEYCFYKGKFSDVYVTVEDSLNYYALLRVLKEAYGVGEPSSEYKDKRLWYGHRVEASYTLYGDTENSEFHMFSRAVESQQEADEKAKAKEGAKGL
jgi:hypothetical protein